VGGTRNYLATLALVISPACLIPSYHIHFTGHLLIYHYRWNSAIFITIPFVQFPVAVVTSDFLSVQDDWNATRPGYWDKLDDNISEALSDLIPRVAILKSSPMSNAWTNSWIHSAG
jgi:hypothetical protein